MHQIEHQRQINQRGEIRAEIHGSENAVFDDIIRRHHGYQL